MMFILAKINTRNQAGMSYRAMQQIVEAIFDALYIIHSSQLSDHKVQLHLVAALESLKREGDLLCQSHREHLLEMLKEEHSNTGKCIGELISLATSEADTELEYKSSETLSSISSNFEGDSTSNKSFRKLLGRIRRNQSL
eukprot:TRINITY_DN15819_c0_g1_i1.p2 TRINITY_DN15819_c0_g1~~TRINITY_DN15819_c0_g1_i1.p2  ORF type:complete len:140 (+),score=4.11 TRINITY_DN15819_c0_g1_i1:135-554(+)